jgi:hypothetical protein
MPDEQQALVSWASCIDVEEAEEMPTREDE